MPSPTGSNRKSTPERMVYYLDLFFYLSVIAMMLVFFFTRNTAKWAFLWPAGAASIARIASYFIKQTNSKRP